MKRRFIQGLLMLALLCGAVLLAHPAAAWAGTIEPKQPEQKNGVYQISSAGELYWFAGLVNGDTTIIGTETQKNTAASAVLTEDIVLNKKVLDEKGNLNGDGSSFTKWTPIGDNTPYTGTFDGAGYEISGLYIDSDQQYLGLFGTVGYGGTVRNLTLTDSYVSGKGDADLSYQDVGGICGNNDGTIENCCNGSTVTGSDNAGGICAFNTRTIKNCSNSGRVTGSGEVGGICGDDFSGTIENCGNSGNVFVTGSEGHVGGICGMNYGGTIAYCSNIGSVAGGANIGSICGTNVKIIRNCYWLSDTADHGVGGDSEDGATKKSEEEYKSGEVAWLLNGSSTNGPWRQNLTGTKIDDFPTLDQTHHIVKYDGEKYTNDEHEYLNGFCTICGSYEPAMQDASGIYQIENAGQLYWFAELVNSGQTTVNAVLTDNITINSNVLDEDGKLNGDGSSFTKWTPIGDNTPYIGTFEGKGHTISGLYIEDSTARYVGLFAEIGSQGIVQNITLADSYVSSSNSSTDAIYAGGICGKNQGKIINCANSGRVSCSAKGMSCVGGICGENRNRIINCSNSGAVSNESQSAVGGICGDNHGNMTNCSNIGTVSGESSSAVGAVCGWNSGSIGIGISHCYWLKTADDGAGIGGGSGTDEDIESKTADQYASGEVAWLLNQWQGSNNLNGKVWAMGEDGYPVLNGKSDNTVVKLTFDANTGNAADNVIRYANTGADLPSVKEPVREGYTFTGWNTTIDGSGMSAPEITPDADITLYAQWEKAAYKVTLNTNNGTIDSGSITDYTYGTETTLPTDVTRAGYTFAGWYDNEALSGEPETVIPADAMGDKEYWAKWTANTYKVTLNTNNGTINSGNITGYTFGRGATLPTDVTRLGYTFAGWYDNEALSGEPETVIPADAMGDKEYWAKWTAKSTPSTPLTLSEKIIAAIKAADPGETVTVDLTGSDTTLDKEVFETLAGKDVTLVIDLGDGVSWTVNGTDVPENVDFTDIDMGVTMNSDGIPVEVINAITGERGSVQITLAHDGAFGFIMTLTAPLGKENASYWANLYHFDEDAGTMTFETAAPIGSDGSVSLALSHASQYAIVIDDYNHGIVTLPFADVSEGDWFYDPVCYVYSQGLMTGTSATTFEPNTSLSRAMLVAVLHRLEGSPAASAGDFTDVADGDWYAEAVNWAASVGVVNGFDDGTFQPNAAITREQLAAILRNYAAYKGMDVTATGDLTNYSDAASVSAWAKDSVAWAVEQGLLSGMTVDTLQPQGLSTRAQVAAVLQRYLEN